MKNPEIENYKNVLGLSCIENHILAIMNANKISNSIVFENSFVDLEQIGNYFLAQKANFAEFCKIPRIQNDLKDSGAISMRLGFSDVWEILSGVEENSDRFLLASIIPEQANKLLYTRGWRSDHYVLVKKAGECVKIINDIPAMELTVSKENFGDIYGGSYFELTFNEIEMKRSCQDNTTIFIDKLVKLNAKKSDLFQFINDDVNIEMLSYLRDLVGVCKIVYARQKELLKSSFDCLELNELQSALSSIYMQLEYYNVKSQFDLKNITEIIKNIENIDYEFQNIIKTGVVKYEYDRRKNQPGDISTVAN